MFITFEGADGVGKSTQVGMLRDYLQERGKEVVVTREPGGNDFAESVRRMLKENPHIDAISETMLLFAARREHFVNVIKPAMDQGKYVICDRFYDSTIVYQGCLKHVNIEHIMQLKEMVVGDCEPNLTIVMNLDYESSLKRVQSRGKADEYDLMKKAQYEVIRKSFEQLSEIFSYRAILVNAKGSADVVFSRILKEIKKRKLSDF